MPGVKWSFAERDSSRIGHESAAEAEVRPEFRLYSA